MSLNFGTSQLASVQAYKVLIQQPVPDEFGAVHKAYLDSRLVDLKAEILGPDVSAALDTLKEIQTYLETNNLTGALLTSINNLGVEIGVERQRITSEIARALEAEGVLRTDLTAEAAARLAGDAQQASSLSLEVSRAQMAEASLRTDLTAESATRLAEDGILNDKIDYTYNTLIEINSQNMAVVVAADNALSASIVAESAERKSEDALISASVVAETAERKSADDVIVASVVAETARAVSAENRYYSGAGFDIADGTKELYFSSRWKLSGSLDGKRLIFSYNRALEGQPEEWVTAIPFISTE